MDDPSFRRDAEERESWEAPFQPARFFAEFELPPAEDSIRQDAGLAVRREFRDCSRWKRLRCRNVSVISERDRGTVYALHVGGAIEFDWTWEGAIAFRPHAFDETGDETIDLADFEQSSVEEASAWSGEVLEVDERHGCLFIGASDSENPPTLGSFLVRPFEFLSTLNDVYHADRFQTVRIALQKRLGAAAGGIHPLLANAASVGLPELRDWWWHAWSVLWGPPGTGKTYTIGRQIAAVLADPTERILAVSTTNRAADALALAVGCAARELCPEVLNEGRILRIGKGASPTEYRDAALECLLQGTESETLERIDDLARQLELHEDWDDKALTRKQIAELRAGGNDKSKQVFLDPAVRVVVATAFKAVQFLEEESVRKLLENRESPFTTIFIDEAGLISRAAVAALSLPASRRVVLVGDSKQLAPISRTARVLPTRQETWLASSGLSHLEEAGDVPAGVHVLLEQRRMHPDICRVVSEYQYGGALTTAAEILHRNTPLPELFTSDARAVWYVLDEEGEDLASLRAERGAGNRSWVRAITRTVLGKLFRDPAVRRLRGLFISPFKAQAQEISKWLASEDITAWKASTVHSRQGSEADVVVFDTVNAGSCSWPFDEWKRLVNVGLSRAKEAVILLASRSEMEEPYLRPLANTLAPRILVKQGGQYHWEEVEGCRPPGKPAVSSAMPNNLGGRIAERKSLRPVLSQEQQRLSNLELDGKPRLVRGVAGSGKTLVLSNWVAKTVTRLIDDRDARIWAVYANRSLHKLLQNSIEAAWSEKNATPFPWRNLSLLHVREVLDRLLPSVSLSMDCFDFEYDRAAEEFLNRQGERSLAPRCRALFIDEAQDMGPNTLRLLLSMVEQTDAEDRNSRSAHIFFDNAQNIYGRKTPKWSEFGLDMRGRSTIMRESFRSTNPIMELAVNLLHRIAPAAELHDHKELLSLGLLERTQRNGEDWLRVRFNQVHGPKPFFRRFDGWDEQIRSIGNHLIHLITKEGIAAEDICLIYNGKSVAKFLEERLSPRLAEIDVELSVQTNRAFERRANTLLVTTSHSFKGYDAEVVLIPFADQFTTHDGRILAANLYVAMTRARSILAIYSTNGGNSAAERLNDALALCVTALNSTPSIDMDDCRDDRVR